MTLFVRYSQMCCFLLRWWTSGISTMLSQNPKFQQYKGWAVLWGGIVKHDSGSYAVFTEQGSSASKMVAAEVVDVIARPPGCCWNFQSQNAQMYGYVYHDTKGQKSRSNIEDPVVPLERHLNGHPLAGLLWEKHVEKVPLGLGWRKAPNWECLPVHRQQGLFLSVCVDDIEAGRKQNLSPMWKECMKLVDLGERPRVLGDALNVNVNRTEVFFEEYKRCSNHESSP